MAEGSGAAGCFALSPSGLRGTVLPAPGPVASGLGSQVPSRHRSRPGSGAARCVTALTCSTGLLSMALPASRWVAVVVPLHRCLPLRMAGELPRSTPTPSLPRTAGRGHGHCLEVGSHPLAVPGRALLSWRGKAHPDHHIKPQGEFALECFVCQEWVPVE